MEIAAFENKFARLWIRGDNCAQFRGRLDGKWFRNIGFASALSDFFGDHRNMTQMFASLRDLKSGNVGQLNIHHYEG